LEQSKAYGEQEKELFAMQMIIKMNNKETNAKNQAFNGK